jgi:hypothetical protein
MWLILIALACVLSISGTTASAQQQPTDLNNLGPRAVGPLQVGLETTFELDIENLGPEPALTYLTELLIFKDQDQVFQDFVEMPFLPSGEAAVAQFVMTWTPDEEGTYIVQSNVLIENDLNPNNNSKITEIIVARPFISIEEAIDSLLNGVIFQREDPEAITAHYNRPPSNEADSVLMPGTMITNWDGDVTTVEVPSYVFFVDSTPGDFWEHAADVVLIPATFNSGVPIQVFPTPSPISIEATKIPGVKNAGL